MARDGMDQQLLVSGRVTLCYLASANVADCLDLASFWFSLVGWSSMDGGNDGNGGGSGC